MAKLATAFAFNDWRLHADADAAQTRSVTAQVLEDGCLPVKISSIRFATCRSAKKSLMINTKIEYVEFASRRQVYSAGYERKTMPLTASARNGFARPESRLPRHTNAVWESDVSATCMTQAGYTKGMTTNGRRRGRDLWPSSTNQFSCKPRCANTRQTSLIADFRSEVASTKSPFRRGERRKWRAGCWMR